MKRQVRVFPMFLLAVLALAAQAESMDSGELSWGKKRSKQRDINYPHKRHFDVMKQRGDDCMRCHPFMKNRLEDRERLAKLNRVANEPLKAICHECHVVELSAPWRCEICHSDPASIRPPSHDFNYRHTHAEDGRRNDAECRTCHVALSFCTDCHFRRDSTQHHMHRLGYRSVHGLDARLDPAACGRCHNQAYCRDCHGARR